ncbi:MAG: helix-turn-helix domain-containing protein [Ignavibacteriae bacterium]|nr:helix-turn-helix domain-containing protein [Ignavibacteriota bacterium]
MKPITRYLSVKEVAAIIRLSEKTVYKLINRGEIAGHFLLGSIHMIDEEIFMTDLKVRATTKKLTKKVTESRDKHGLLR